MTPYLIKIDVMPGNKRYKMHKHDFLIGKTDPEIDKFYDLLFARWDIEISKIPHFIKRIAPSVFCQCCRLQRIEFDECTQLKNHWFSSILLFIIDIS